MSNEKSNSGRSTYYIVMCWDWWSRWTPYCPVFPYFFLIWKSICHNNFLTLWNRGRGRAGGRRCQIRPVFSDLNYCFPPPLVHTAHCARCRHFLKFLESFGRHLDIGLNYMDSIPTVFPPVHLLHHNIHRDHHQHHQHHQHQHSAISLGQGSGWDSLRSMLARFISSLSPLLLRCIARVLALALSEDSFRQKSYDIHGS